MTDIDRIEQRLSAVERTVVDGDYELTELTELTSLAEDVEELESRLDSLEQRFAELEASAQATQGYVSNIQSVNEDVEQQADAAIAAVDRLEDRIETLEATLEHRQANQESASNPSSATNGSDPGRTGNPDRTAQPDRGGEAFTPDLEASPTPAGGEQQAGDSREPRPVSAADQAAVEESVGGRPPEDTPDDSGGDRGLLRSLVAKLPP